MADVSGRGPTLRSKLDTRSDDYRSNLDAMSALWAQVEAQLAAVPVDRRPALRRPPSRPRQDARARTDRGTRRPELGVPRAQPAGGVGHAGSDRRRHGVRDRRRRGRRGRDQRHRHDVSRRLDEPDDADQERPPLRDHPAQPPAGDHAQRVGRCRPAAAGRHLRAGRRGLQEPHPALQNGDPFDHARLRTGDRRAVPTSPA